MNPFITPTEETLDKIAEAVSNCNLLSEQIRDLCHLLETASGDYHSNLTTIMRHDNHVALISLENRINDIQNYRRKMQADMFAVTSKLALDEALNRLP